MASMSIALMEIGTIANSTRGRGGEGEGFWGIESVEGSKNLKGVEIRELRKLFLRMQGKELKFNK